MNAEVKRVSFFIDKISTFSFIAIFIVSVGKRVFIPVFGAS